MKTLCLMSNITPEQWAAWAQAVLSAVAIVAAVLIANWQSRKQHNNDLKLQEHERVSEQLQIVRSIEVLARNSSITMSKIYDELVDMQSFMDVAEGKKYSFIGELTRIDTYISGFPFHALPPSVTNETMILASTVRQFKESVDIAVKLYAVMNTSSFGEFISSLDEINKSIKVTHEEISKIAGVLAEHLNVDE